MLTNRFDQPCPLMKETIRLIREKGVEVTAFETRVPFGWLNKLVGGHFRNPSVNRVAHVYEKLSGTKLLSGG